MNLCRIHLLALLLTASSAIGQTSNALFIPDTIGGSVINLSIASGTVQYLPGAVTETYGINQAYLGPTMILYKGSTVQLNVTNGLADTTTMHWHGMHVPAMDDGGPHTPIPAGTVWSPNITVMDEASTFWYHPHLHHHTAEQVYMGAAGLILVHDSVEHALGLPHTYGVDDFPLILQDKSFDSLTNEFIYEALSDTMMVNGTLAPYLVVPVQMVRLRILNASNQRVYNLGFPPTNIAFQIASDGGLLEHPLPITRIQIAPGERAEVIVDFSIATTNFPLMANNSEMGAGISGAPMGPHGGNGNPLDGNNFQILDFRLGPQTPNPVTILPNNLRIYDIPSLLDVDRVRVKVFDTVNVGYPYYINSTPYDMEVNNDTVRLGDTEIWELYNETDIAHPFHIHDVQFHVIEKNGNPPPAHLAGRKDVILSQPGDTIRFITRFDDFADDAMPYMYHCHNLFHEDGGMMAQFIVMDTLLSGSSDPRFDFLGGSISVFPNPTKDWLQIDNRASGQEPLELIELCDLHGRKLEIAALDYPSATHRLDLSVYSAGIYLLKLRQKSGKTLVLRIAKE